MEKIFIGIKNQNGIFGTFIETENLEINQDFILANINNFNFFKDEMALIENDEFFNAYFLNNNSIENKQFNQKPQIIANNLQTIINNAKSLIKNQQITQIATKSIQKVSLRVKNYFGVSNEINETLFQVENNAEITETLEAPQEMEAQESQNQTQEIQAQQEVKLEDTETEVLETKNDNEINTESVETLENMDISESLFANETQQISQEPQELQETEATTNEALENAQEVESQQETEIQEIAETLEAPQEVTENVDPQQILQNLVSILQPQTLQEAEDITNETLENIQETKLENVEILETKNDDTKKSKLERIAFTSTELLRRDRESESFSGEFIEVRGVKSRIRANLEAINTMISIFENARENNQTPSATKEQQEILSKYSGFGGLNEFWKDEWKAENDNLREILGQSYMATLAVSSDSAFYTPNELIKSMYFGLEQLGVRETTKDKIYALEPSCGIGKFFRYAPKNYEFSGIEMDLISANIAKLLNPGVSIYNNRFENVHFRNEFDIVVGNPPYANEIIYDLESKAHKSLVHNYFVVRGNELLKEGGILNYVITHNFLDNKNGNGANCRKMIFNKNSELVRAIRIPNDTFKSVNADILTDIIYYYKNDGIREKSADELLNQKRPRYDTLDLIQKNGLSVSKTYIATNSFIDTNEATWNHYIGSKEIATNAFGEDVLRVNYAYDDEKNKPLSEIIKSINSSMITLSNEKEKFLPNEPKKDEAISLFEIEHKLTDKDRENLNKLSPGNVFKSEADEFYMIEPGMFLSELYFEKEVKNDEMQDLNVAQKDILKINKNTTIIKEYLSNSDRAVLKAVIDFRDSLKEMLESEKALPNDDKSNNIILEQKNSLKRKRDRILEFYEGFGKAKDGYFNKNYRAKTKDGEILHPLKSIIKLDGLDSYRIFALEDIKKRIEVNRNGNDKTIVEVTLNEILNKRIFVPKVKTISQSETEALQKTIYEKGKIDLETLQSYMPNKNLRDILKNLLDNKLIYPNIENPKEPFILKNEFLKGNIKNKAKLYSDFNFNSIGENNPNYEAFKDLEKFSDLIDFNACKNDLAENFNDDIKFLDLNANFGANFIPIEAYKEYFKTLLIEPEKFDENVKVYKVNGNVFFKTDLGLNAYTNYAQTIAALQKTKDMFNPNRKPKLKKKDEEEKIIEALMPFSISDFLTRVAQNQNIEIKQQNPATEKYEKDKDATISAKTKMELLRQDFLEFLYKRKDLQEKIEKTYNDTINVYSKEILEFKDYNLEIDSAMKPRAHQTNGFFKGVMAKSMLFDHQVGAGKTLLACMLVMEQKRMGLINKALLIVPNHLTEQWANELLKAYPSANILVGNNIKSRKDRKQFLHKARYGNFDAIIMKHSTFENLRTLNQYENEFAEKQNEAIAKIAETLNEAGILEDKKEKHKFLARGERVIEKYIEGATKISVDDEMSIEDLGCDCFIVDEVQEFKNLLVLSAKDNVKGMPTRASFKALKMYYLTQYAQEKEHKLYLATGTPVSNSIAEMFVMQTYIQSKTLKDLGLDNFDEWCNTFCEINAVDELDSTGINFTIVNRLNSFVNVPELLKIYKQNADIISNDDIKKLNNGKSLVPKLKDNRPTNVVCKKSDEVASYIGIEDERGNFNKGSLVHRAENFRADPKNNNMLKIFSDGTKASLDYRLIDPNAKDFEESKINTMIKNVKENYDNPKYPKNTQLIFCDLGVSKIKSQKITENTNLFQSISKEKVIKEQNLVEDFDDNGNPKYVRIVNKETRIPVKRNFQYEDITNKDDNITKGNIILKDDEEIEYEMSANDLLEALSNNFNVYADILQKLVKLGIPQKEIAFINDASNDKQKQDLFQKVNNGEIRILIGSTKKMGAGTNVQTRLIANHLLTIPLRPCDIEQTDGRLIRPGNMWFSKYGDDFEPQIYRYATEGTLDAKILQINESKLRAIKQLRNSNNINRNLDSIDEELSSIADLKAEATGNPYIIERQKIEKMIQKEELLQKNYLGQIQNAEYLIPLLKQQEVNAKADLETLNKLSLIRLEGNFTYEVMLEEKKLNFKTTKEFGGDEKNKDAKKIFINTKEKIQENIPQNIIMMNFNEKVSILKFKDFEVGFLKDAEENQKEKNDSNIIEGDCLTQGFIKIEDNVIFDKRLNHKFTSNSSINIKNYLDKVANVLNDMPNLIQSKKSEITSINKRLIDNTKFLETNRNIDDYPRKNIKNMLNADFENIRMINSEYRKIKQSGEVPNDDHPFIKERLPKYKEFLDSKGNIDLELLNKSGKKFTANFGEFEPNDSENSDNEDEFLIKINGSFFGEDSTDKYVKEGDKYVKIETTEQTGFVLTDAEMPEVPYEQPIKIKRAKSIEINDFSSDDIESRMNILEKNQQNLKEAERIAPTLETGANKNIIQKVKEKMLAHKEKDKEDKKL